MRSPSRLEKARLFVDALAASGYDVWWDAALRAGDSYDKSIERALRESQTVIVLWSCDPVKSRWVRAEATLVDQLGKLVPVIIDQCDRPVVFALLQTADLSGWKGNTADGRWLRFVDDLGKRILPPAAPEIGLPAATRPRAWLALPSKPSIAAPAFKELDDRQTWLADGLVEEISRLVALRDAFCHCRGEQPYVS